MKITVLIDNNTLIDRYFLAEPGVCYLIEDGGKKILFDVGYSEAFIANARRLSIDLLDVDEVVLSHGHLDHTWGLEALLRLHSEAAGEKLPHKRPRLLAHPLVFSSRKSERLPQLGAMLSEEALSVFFNLELSRQPVFISERLVFLGEIERSNDFEAQKPLGKIIQEGVEIDDFLPDDTALAYISSGGLVIITGCSHSGICNIVEHARKVCGVQPVLDILGGFHLLNPPAWQLQGTLEYMQNLAPGALHACHCTDLPSKIALSGVANLKEVGVGLSLEF
jgi:7,8-dihydropterin-6-yl-methyl-4-(beta-D-ribofuranosyl)aminobenzene 5'-phosphate synthase